MENYDVIIVGGGLAGLSLSIQLKQQNKNLTVAVFEKNKYPLTQEAHKVGESLVELASYYFSEVLGLKDHLQNSQLPKLGLRFFFKNPKLKNVGANGAVKHQLISDYVEVGAREFPHSPSYQLDRVSFENYLVQYAEQLDVKIFDQHKILELDISDKKKVTVRDLSDHSCSEFKATWLVDACSRTSVLKRQENLSKENEHHVNAVWFKLDSKLDFNAFSDDRRWLNNNDKDTSRWFSTNHLMGEGYWVWLIPLSGNKTSIGIVAADDAVPVTRYNTIDKALQWLQANEPVLTKQLEFHREHISNFKFLKNISHDCKQVFSDKGWFLTGEAGLFLDPFYSPGSDFIAVSNTFICQLINSGLDEKALKKECFILNVFYKNLYENSLQLYSNQYSAFSNVYVMTVKISWDFAVYWTFNCFIYMQNLIKDAASIVELRDLFSQIGELNSSIQNYFKVWSKLENRVSQGVYIDFFSIPFLKKLNEDLDKNYVSRNKKIDQLVRNIEQLSVFYKDILSTVNELYPELRSMPTVDIETQCEHSVVENIFSQLNNKLMN